MTSLKSLYKGICFKLFSVYEHYTLPFSLTKELGNKWTILDIACGYSSSIRSIEEGSYKVGLDFFKPYILNSKTLSLHNDYVLGDVRALPFKSKSFDCVVATEIIEHLIKADGLVMINQMEEVAKEKIFLTTPNGFLPTYAGPDDNPEESHLSGWHAGELKELGFKVYGLGGLKLFWTIKSGKAMRKSPQKLYALLAGITELFLFRHPGTAFQLFGVKEVKH